MLPFLYTIVCPHDTDKIRHISDTISCGGSASFTFLVKRSHCNGEYTLNVYHHNIQDYITPIMENITKFEDICNVTLTINVTLSYNDNIIQVFIRPKISSESPDCSNNFTLFVQGLYYKLYYITINLEIFDIKNFLYALICTKNYSLLFYYKLNNKQ